jgi:glycosyltransferase involved in cell wall biosynthesis
MAKNLFINTHMPPDYHYGGVVESGSKLFAALSELSDWNCISVSKSPRSLEKYAPEGSVCISKSLLLHGYGFSIEYLFDVFKKIRKSQFVFVNGTVTFPTVTAQLICWLLRKPYAVSLRAALEPWAINSKKWKKFLYYKLLILPLLKKAEFIHVTSEKEQKSAMRHLLNNIRIISNGIDIDEISKDMTNEKDDGVFKFLFMGRTSKEKGIDLLIPAFKRVSERVGAAKVQLLIVGPDNHGYFRNSFFPLPENIKYIDGVYGKDKFLLYRQADFFVLPSYSENFGNVVAEALACDIPVITTTGTPWTEVEQFKCGFYINLSDDELEKAMLKAYSTSAREREQMGIRGRSLIENKYQWRQKAAELQEEIDKCLKLK